MQGPDSLSAILDTNELAFQKELGTIKGVTVKIQVHLQVQSLSHFLYTRRCRMS